MKWEYLVTTLPTTGATPALNRYGQEAWELVAVAAVDAERHTLYFKRRADDDFRAPVPKPGQDQTEGSP